MKTLKPVLLATGVALLMCAGASAGETLRCGSRLVSIGDGMSTVKNACGEPDRIEIREEAENAWVQRHYDPKEGRYQAPRLIKGPIRVEVWIYDPGPQRLVRRLRFENEELVRIDTESREN